MKKHSLNSLKSNGRINENEYKSNDLNRDKTISKLSSIDNRQKDKSNNDNNENDSLGNLSGLLQENGKINNEIIYNEENINNMNNNKDGDVVLKLKTSDHINSENSSSQNYNESDYESYESERDISRDIEISNSKRRKLSDNNNDNIQIHSFLDT